MWSLFAALLFFCESFLFRLFVVSCVVLLLVVLFFLFFCFLFFFGGGDLNDKYTIIYRYSFTLKITTFKKTLYSARLLSVHVRA